jgi:mannitol-specific phosphotransferase system IIBC component
MNNQRKPNYTAFIPIGITFLGTGVVFMTAVNPGVGIGLLGVGIAFLIIGIRKRKQE